MSTTSEEEAMSCLRMARKKGKSFDAPESNTATYNGQTAKYWYDKAYVWYHEAKKRGEGLSREQQVTIYREYKASLEANYNLRREVRELKEMLAQKKTDRSKLPLIMLQFGIIIMMMVLLIS
jgi:hypothetical protein